MALTLANILTRVKRYVPSEQYDTEIQDAILERMNYLVSLDTFPFQEAYMTYTVSIGDYRIATPSDFAIMKELAIWTSGKETILEVLDSTAFGRLYPAIASASNAKPHTASVKVAEGELWFNCPCDAAYEFRTLIYKIPDDATDTTVSQLTELAKITLEKWGCADGFRMMSEHDRADKMEAEGNKMLAAMKRRYQLAIEEGARFISRKEEFLRRRS